MSAKICRLPRSQTLLKELPGYQRLWEYFLMLTEVPRPSGNLDAVRERIREVVNETMPGVQILTDNIGNILLRKEASGNMKHLPGICIQGHMDMVTTKATGHRFDFETDPIDVKTDGTWMHANKTTLGADNGIGVAAGMALLSKSDEPMPMLECLITVDEETTMAGAEFLRANMLRSSILINCDSEEENAVCIGCAGGQENLMKLPVNTEVPPGDHIAITLKLSGLRGGHSGAEIHCGLGNAAKLLTRIMNYSTTDHMVYIAKFSAGNAVNAIPNSAEAAVIVPLSEEAKFIERAKEQFSWITKEYQAVEGVFNSDTQEYSVQMKFSVERIPSLELFPQVASMESSQKILDFLTAVPHGVLRMSYEDPGRVETSTSLSLVELKLDEPMVHLMVHTFTRSSRNSSMKMFALENASICRLAGAEDSGPTNAFPGWAPNLASRALCAAVRAYKAVNATDEPPRIYTIHAGLETGLILKNYPLLDCISIGPEILHAHSIHEKMNIPSVAKFWDFLLAIIEDLKHTH